MEYSWEVNYVFTIHGTKTQDCNHDSKEDTAKGAKEGITKVQSDGPALGNDILRRELNLV